MFFKFFQLLLRWFPVLQALIQKKRASKAMVYRKVFNPTFSGIMRDPDAVGSPTNPKYIRQGGWSLVPNDINRRINTYGTGFDKYRLVKVKVFTKRTAVMFMGGTPTDSMALLTPSLIKDLKTLVGRVLYFDTEKVKALVIDVFNRDTSRPIRSAVPEVYIVMLILAPECEDFISVEIPTISWELGAIPKKDLPITHILRERDAKRAIRRVREVIRNGDRPGVL